MEELARRRSETDRRISELQSHLGEAEGLIKGKACVYATGSFGRREASQYSDLDLFIVGQKNGEKDHNGIEGSKLKRLDDICLKADLIEETRRLGIPEFDGDGRYLTHYSVHEFTKTLGTPEDDVTNTFTARLLLLLESFPLLGPRIYEDVINEVLSEYWQDFEDHKNDFVPGFLVNDILRLWRTFCVNYEARTEKNPDEKKAKRKLKNYKLKHSRLLTCYSALLYLLAIFERKGTVSPDDAREMSALSPTERLECLLKKPALVNVHESINGVMHQYDYFLKNTNSPENNLIEIFMDREKSAPFMKSAYDLGDKMFEAIRKIGNGNRLHRLIVV